VISASNEFGVYEVREQFLLHLSRTEILQRTLPERKLFLHQLPAIQHRGKKSLGILSEV